MVDFGVFWLGDWSRWMGRSRKVDMYIKIASVTCSTAYVHTQDLHTAHPWTGLGQFSESIMC